MTTRLDEIRVGDKFLAHWTGRVGTVRYKTHGWVEVRMNGEQKDEMWSCGSFVTPIEDATEFLIDIPEFQDVHTNRPNINGFLICSNCKKEFTHNKRGRKPHTCPECRTISSPNTTTEPRKPVDLVCISCSKVFTHPVQRGRKPSTCPECKPVKEVNISDKITCRNCGKEFPRPIRRGRPPVVCEECK